jgi:hypothetical protein
MTGDQISPVSSAELTDGAGGLMINILRFAAIRSAHLRSKHESDLIQASSVSTRRDPAQFPRET